MFIRMRYLAAACIAAMLVSAPAFACTMGATKVEGGTHYTCSCYGGNPNDCYWKPDGNVSCPEGATKIEGGYSYRCKCIGNDCSWWPGS